MSEQQMSMDELKAEGEKQARQQRIDLMAARIFVLGTSASEAYNRAEALEEERDTRIGVVKKPRPGELEGVQARERARIASWIEKLPMGTLTSSIVRRVRLGEFA